MTHNRPLCFRLLCGKRKGEGKTAAEKMLFAFFLPVVVLTKPKRKGLRLDAQQTKLFANAFLRLQRGEKTALLRFLKIGFFCGSCFVGRWLAPAAWHGRTSQKRPPYARDVEDVAPYKMPPGKRREQALALQEKISGKEMFLTGESFPF